MDLRYNLAGVGRDHKEIDLISADADFVMDNDAIVQPGSQLDQPSVRAGLDPLGSMRNDGLGRIAPGRTRATERLDIPDLQRSAGEVLPVDGQHLLIPAQREFAVGAERHEWPNDEGVPEGAIPIVVRIHCNRRRAMASHLYAHVVNRAGEPTVLAASWEVARETVRSRKTRDSNKRIKGSTNRGRQPDEYAREVGECVRQLAVATDDGQVLKELSSRTECKTAKDDPDVAVARRADAKPEDRKQDEDSAVNHLVEIGKFEPREPCSTSLIQEPGKGTREDRQRPAHGHHESSHFQQMHDRHIGLCSVG